jgi:hypothetical protein
MRAAMVACKVAGRHLHATISHSRNSYCKYFSTSGTVGKRSNAPDRLLLDGRTAWDCGGRFTSWV